MVKVVKKKVNSGKYFDTEGVLINFFRYITFATYLNIIYLGAYLKLCT
jgi:hypothetical protein